LKRYLASLSSYNIHTERSSFRLLPKENVATFAKALAREADRALSLPAAKSFIFTNTVASNTTDHTINSLHFLFESQGANKCQLTESIDA
jgi:hypothetical protein